MTPGFCSWIYCRLYVRQFVEEKVKGWSSDVAHLAKVIQNQLQLFIFTKGLASQWIHVSCTVSDISMFMQLLEDVIYFKLIPALTGQAPPNDFELDLFALPP